MPSGKSSGNVRRDCSVTVVLSESMRVQPDEGVIRWLDSHPPSSLFLSAITVDEITFGIELLPPGRKRMRLTRAFSRIVDAFSERIVPFDITAATESARFRARRRLAGSPMSLADSQIAGTAKSRDFSLATLNTRDFHGIDLALLI